MRNRIMIYGLLFILGMYLAPGFTGVADPTPQRADAEAYRRAVEVQGRHEQQILRTPGVRGVGIAPEGQGFSLLVLYPKDGAPPVLSARYENLPVRYYPVGEIMAQSLLPPDNGPNHRVPHPLPVPMGVSGGHALLCGGFCTGGTLGFKVCDASSGQVGYITNNHVAAAGCPDFCPNTAPIGTTQRQPGSIDNGCSAAQNIGTLSRFVTISGGGSNQVDGAFIASSDSQVSSNILDIGIPSTTPVDPSLNATVWKSGRTTGFTTGKVVGKNLTITVNYGSACSFATFNQQLMIAPDSGFSSFSASGDSGAPVTDTGANPVGLLFAGDGINAFVNPIGQVLSQLNVTLGCIGTPPPPPPPPPPPGTCPATAAVSGARNSASTLSLIYQFRDNIMASSPRGQSYTNLFVQHSAEGAALLLRDPALRSQTQTLIEHFAPAIQNLVNGDVVSISEDDLNLVDRWIETVTPRTSRDLRQTLQKLRTDMRDPSVVSQFGARLAPTR